MSKFKIGDKVLRVDSYVWNFDEGYIQKGKNYVIAEVDCTRVRVEGCSIWYSEMGFELVEQEQTEAPPTPHVHHDMIVEWAANPSRVVQWRDNDDCVWLDCSEDEVHPFPVWDMNTQYRFKPVEPERVFPKTSLGIKELASHVVSEHETVSIASLEAVANAAIKQYILDMEKA